ncbi:MAG: NERD domain-containing protein [Clostridia bacterium]|nr:NERD domain-containing protein [Clostridia bacterium]MBQ7699185.1 NERD domain-containing protein [Clostridia bacterium]
MDFIGILLTVAGVAVVSLIVAALVSAFYHSQRSRARRKGKLNARQELEAFLLDTTYRRNVFAHLYFPVLVDGTKRTHHYQRVDAVVVTKGGVLVLTVFDKTGRIDNSRDDVWVVIQDDDRTEVESPVISMEKSRAAIKGVLKRAGYGKVPIYSTVLLAYDEAIPLSDYEGIVYLSELEKLIHDMNKIPEFGSIEQFYICRTLKRAGLTKETIKRKQL